MSKPMSSDNVRVVLVHRACADESSWAKVIGSLAAEGVRVLAASLPLTSFADDTAALEHAVASFRSGSCPGPRYAGASCRLRSLPTAPRLVVDIIGEAIRKTRRS